MHKRLRAAYLDTMAALGVPLTLADNDPLAFLDAMAGLKNTGDLAELTVLTAIKQSAKGTTIGTPRYTPKALLIGRPAVVPHHHRSLTGPVAAAMAVTTARSAAV